MVFTLPFLNITVWLLHFHSYLRLIVKIPDWLTVSVCAFIFKAKTDFSFSSRGYNSLTHSMSEGGRVFLCDVFYHVKAALKGGSVDEVKPIQHSWTVSEVVKGQKLSNRLGPLRDTKHAHSRLFIFDIAGSIYVINHPPPHYFHMVPIQYPFFFKLCIFAD